MSEKPFEDAAGGASVILEFWLPGLYTGDHTRPERRLICQGGSLAVQHTELLKRAYQRNGGWGKQSTVYIDLLGMVNEQLKSEKVWSQSSLESVDKWQPKGADNLGLWQPPTSYGLVTAGKANKHHNQLRKISTGRILTLGQITD